MKTLSIFFVISLAIQTANAQNRQADISKPDPAKKIEVVELSCGQCKFNLKGKSCDLAVRIKRKAYFVDGANIDDFGDAHGKMGFCNAIRNAEVQGEIVDNRFKATYIKLLPVKK
ncbi:MAG: DUF6370 family protein [Chitinophagaceae bacterium]|nr:DUF6370 family protein [Chitinophagaceae bacterium]